jgi:pimeloyl-ACP methyl ester carboxylesterase
MALGRRASEPLCRLLRFEATDGAPLAGLLFEPRRRTSRAVIFLHGTGGSSVFESKRTNAIAPAFAREGLAYFAFNNRGSHVIRRLGRDFGGSAFERIRDCVLDVDGAVRELWSRGYRDLTLVGHSTGANKIGVYDSLKRRNRVKRYVLLGGGDDTGMLYAQLGPRRFAAALARARTMIRDRRGAELVPRGLYSMPMSWRAFYDMANPNGDYNVFPFLEVMRNVRLSRRPRFRHLRGIRKPALFVYGENDEYQYGDVSRCVAILAEALGPRPNVEIAVMAGADHGFGGREEELAELITLWITSSRGSSPRRSWPGRSG